MTIFTINTAQSNTIGSMWLNADWTIFKSVKKHWYFISWFPNRLLKTFMTNFAAQCEAAQCHSYHLRWAALELLHQLLRSLLIAINNPWRCIYPPSPPPPKSSIHVTVKSEQNRTCLIFYSQFFVDNVQISIWYDLSFIPTFFLK